MLLRWQRHVEVVHGLTNRDLRRLVDRAEQRQPAITKVIAGGFVIDEADDLIPQLAMFQNLVGDEPSELSRPRDQNSLEAESCRSCYKEQNLYCC